MKHLIVLVFSLLFVGMGTLAAAQVPDVLVPEPTQKGVGLNDYYISVHHPDGSCATFEVFANSYYEAEKIIKAQRCEACVMQDVTSSFTSGDPALIASATRFCPMR